MCLLMYVQDVRVLPCMNGSNSPGRKVQKSTSPHPKNFSALFFITLPWIFHSLLALWLCHFLFAFFPINEVKKKSMVVVCPHSCTLHMFGEMCFKKINEKIIDACDISVSPRKMDRRQYYNAHTKRFIFKENFEAPLFQCEKTLHIYTAAEDNYV